MKDAATYKCYFKEEWSKQYPVARSDGDPNAFCCIPCRKDISCSHQDLSDVTKHCKGVSRISFEKPVKNNQTLNNFLAHDEGDNSLKEKTIRSEALHTNFKVHHNLFFLTVEHLSPLYSKMLPDSKTAKNFKCNGIKTTVIIK